MLRWSRATVLDYNECAERVDALREAYKAGLTPK